MEYCYVFNRILKKWHVRDIKKIREIVSSFKSYIFVSWKIESAHLHQSAQIFHVCYMENIFDRIFLFLNLCVLNFIKRNNNKILNIQNIYPNLQCSNHIVLHHNSLQLSHLILHYLIVGMFLKTIIWWSKKLRKIILGYLIVAMFPK